MNFQRTSGSRYTPGTLSTSSAIRCEVYVTTDSENPLKTLLFHPPFLYWQNHVGQNYG